MPKKDPRVDAYIGKSADFAKPILKHLRQLVHTACPDVEETIKWQMPTFTYKGMLCGMAAFKEHSSFGFWKHKLIFEDGRERDGMGSFGKFRSMADVPSDKEMLGYIKVAMRLNDEGIKTPKPARSNAKKELKSPDYLTAALKKNAKARETWEKFSYSHKKEYVEWLTEAKRDETREKRLATTLEWLTKGKSRNWKYANC
jgi:uncharacterized protein YdeI (YjbR/CyaY-like superfamily)